MEKQPCGTEDWQPVSGEPSAILRPLCFFSDRPNGDAPEYSHIDQQLPGKRKCAHNRVIIPVHVARSTDQHFDLETRSFALLPNAFRDKQTIDFHNPNDVMNKYVPAVEKLILDNVPGSKKVIAYDTTLRKASIVKIPDRQVKKLHVDQSSKGALQRAHCHLSPTEYEAVAQGILRFRIINVWKSIAGTVLDHPLVFADHQSIQQSDLVPVIQKHSDYEGETYALRYRTGHEFWYWSNMRAEDVLSLQCFDSVMQEHSLIGGTTHTPCAHGSFELSETGQDPCERESIELRCLVLG